MKLYLAGKITGDPNYKEKFLRAQKALEEQGHLVMNPANLTEGFPWEDCMPICFAMIDASEATAMLPDWADSQGAMLEQEYTAQSKKVLLYLDNKDKVLYSEKVIGDKEKQSVLRVMYCNECGQAFFIAGPLLRYPGKKKVKGKDWLVCPECLSAQKV